MDRGEIGIVGCLEGWLSSSDDNGESIVESLSGSSSSDDESLLLGSLSEGFSLTGCFCSGAGAGS
jgi:hypothetical protein